ncbi:MAG: recombinase family protein [Candidatus Saccharibacteria bacterium]|nr:recombinase family protein [Candidatus Saccharibacteria bacterium]
MADKLSSIDPTKLRYVMYVRKSSEEDTRQVRSIEDQISDCEQYAARNRLAVKGIVKEQKSAKKPGNRPLFKQMLQDIRDGKYDGILFWHPDRLARNMLEAGEVIDLIDNGTIKDLQSPTFHFENDSSGKMLLGMLFVFAKQYSEHLSESVLRGNENNLKAGKSAGTPKWGYIRGEDGFYKPDNNFELIKRGWEMRADGATLDEILKFWKNNDVHRLTKTNSREGRKSSKITINHKTTVSKIFKDPFYYGILCQADKEINLLDVPNCNFTPMIDKELFVKVQRLFRTQSEKNKNNSEKTFLPLRGMVICAECGGCMVPNTPKNAKGKKYLYYRCDNKECHREGACDF